MDRPGTDAHAKTEQPSRALVATIQTDGDAYRDAPPRRFDRGRPMAVFLAQVMSEADPSLRPARSERTRAAASLYARTDRLVRRA